MLCIPSEVRFDKISEYVEIEMENCDLIVSKNGWIHKKRFLQKYEMIYVAEGIINMSVDEKPYTLKENDLLIIYPYKTIYGIKESTEKTSFYTIEFSCNNFSYFKIKKEHIHVESNFIIELLMRICSLQKNNKKEKYLCDSILITLLYELRSHEEKNTKINALAENISNYIDENISMPLNINNISEKFSYNKDYISRIFKLQYNISLKEYINIKKLYLTKRLLLTSNLTIQKIAQSIGFEDLNLFIKFFKYHENISPMQYREKYKQNI
jgi:AraC-like DNA-binding protein